MQRKQLNALVKRSSPHRPRSCVGQVFFPASFSLADPHTSPLLRSPVRLGSSLARCTTGLGGDAVRSLACSTITRDPCAKFSGNSPGIRALGSLLLGVGPSDGSFHAGQITRGSSEPTSRRPRGHGAVDTMNSTVAVSSPTESSLVIAGPAEDPRWPQFKWTTANSERLSLTQGTRFTPDLAIRPLIPGLNNVTDVCFSLGAHETVVVSNNLELTGTSTPYATAR